MSEPLKVGSTVWIYGYHLNPENPKAGYTSQYKPWPILGESPRLWFVRSLHPKRAIKLPKKRNATNPEYLISEQECRDAIKAREDFERMTKEAEQISWRVKECRNADALKQIAALVGYAPPSPKPPRKEGALS